MPTGKFESLIQRIGDVGLDAKFHAYVAPLQAALGAEPTGIYDEDTATRVATIQASHGFVVNGRIGLEVARVLDQQQRAQQA